MSEIDDLRRELGELRAANAALSARVDALSAAPAAGEARPNPTGDRRSMLKLAAGAAVGAVTAATVTGARPAAAADNGPILAGAITTSGNTGRNATILAYTNAQSPRAPGPLGPVDSSMLLVRDAPAAPPPFFAENFAGHPAAITGSAFRVVNNGVHGYSDRPGGYGVVGQGGGTASIGLMARGSRANARMLPGGLNPTLRADIHAIGEVVADSAGHLWYCVSSGTPGSWRKLAGSTSAGSLHAVTPFRVYDSRWPGGDDKIAANANRIVSVADARDLNTGAVTTTNAVPAGARAVVANLTIAGTNAGAGALAVTPGNAATFSASTINWSGAGVLLANGFTCALDDSRQLKVFCLGTGTHFIVDISGYYL